MRNLSTKISFLLIVLLGLGQSAKAQTFEDIMAMGVTDANTYLENYTKPMMLSFNNGLSSGWYNTAKPHKILGFDLTFTANIANIPKGDRQFNFDDLTWENVGLNSLDRSLPTAVGGNASPGNLFIQNGIQLVDDNTGQTFSYGSNSPIPLPDGFDVNDLPIAGFPVPALTFGLGLPKNTELKVRYGSDFGALEDGSFSLLGFGIMHDIKQWIPGLKQMPFDLSGFVSYVSLSADFPIDVRTTEGSSTFSGNGDVAFKASSFTFQGVISKKLAIFTPYVGLGYNVGSSNLSVNGDYSYTESPGPGLPDQTATFTDPVNLDFSGGSSPRLNAGLRMKLLILTIHAEYALQKYKTFTAGIGLSIR